MKKYSITKHCLELWKTLIKLRAGYVCERESCQSTHVIQSHHIISSTNWNLRFDEENGICLCRACHVIWLKQFPTDYVKWLNEKWPGRLDSLELRRHEKTRHDYTLLKIYLEREISKFKQEEK